MDRSLPVILAASSVAAAAWAVNQLLKTLLRARAGARPALWAPPPHPGWRPPQPQPAPFSGASIPVDPANLPGDQLYPLVISAVVPRPVAFVSTLGSTGAGGCAGRAAGRAGERRCGLAGATRGLLYATLQSSAFAG